MESFIYNSTPSRVIFGSGCLSQLASEIQRLKLSAPLLLTTPEQAAQADDLTESLSKSGVSAAGQFTKAKMHTPIQITEEALNYARSSRADSVISIGGGSTIGLGKAISIRTGLPHICIPTTYAGSEMTPILGETTDRRKTTRSDPKILPGTVLYDVDLTLTLPAALSATSGVNAIAHAVEALYSQSTNPIISLLAIEGISSLAESLPDIVSDPSAGTDIGRRARERALYGAWLSGHCLGSVGMGLHHKLCHTLGGSFNLPHAETHTIVLPHALSYNAPALKKEVLVKIANALPRSDGNAVIGLNVLLDKLQVKRGLKEFGMKEEDVDKAADIACQAQYPNPRPLEREKIREVIRRCWAGEEARTDL